jgi:hypothetical protein
MQKTVLNRLIMLLTVLLLPLHASGAEQIKIKYARSLYTDEKGIGLKQPEGVACSDDRLIVADTGNSRLILFALRDGDPNGGTEIKLDQLRYPTRVAMTSKGDLLVLDERQRKIVRLTRDGAFKQYVDPSGMPTDAMILTIGIDVDAQDNLYLLDIISGRVLVLNNDGKFLRQISFPKEYGFITDLKVDFKGTVFVVDAVQALVYSTAKDPAAFTPITARLKDDLKFASNVAIDKKGTLFISDQNSGGIVVVGQDGSLQNRLLTLGWKEGTVRNPAQICVGKDGDLFVADRANNRIQKFSLLK